MKDKTEALFYVQAPYKVDLPGDMTYQYQWVPMLQNARGWYAKGIFGSNDLPGKADDWLKAIKGTGRRPASRRATSSASPSSAASGRSRTSRATSPPPWNGPAS